MNTYSIRSSLLLVVVGVLLLGAIDFFGPLPVLGQGPGSNSCLGGGTGPDAGCFPPIDISTGDVQLNFSGSPTTINAGNSATLTWSTQSAISCQSSDFTVPPSASYTINGQVYSIGAQNGSVQVSPLSTKTYEITCFGLGMDNSNSATRSVTITVNGGGGGGGTVIPEPEDDPSAGGFTSVFQIDNDEDHDTVFASLPVPTIDLLAGNSTTIALPYVFPNAGDWYMRTCGDVPPYPDGVVDESNEDNNCGPWTMITVGGAQCVDGIDNDGDTLIDDADPGCEGGEVEEEPNQCTDGVDNDGDGAIDVNDGGCDDGDGNESTGDVRVDLTADASIVRSGESTTLRWDSTGASSCAFEGTVPFSTGGRPDGSVSTGPLTNAMNNYSILCGTARDTVTVTVTAPEVSITAQPPLVAVGTNGGTTDLLWSASEVVSCDITSSHGGDPIVNDVDPGTETIRTNVTGITRQTRYTLTCLTIAGPSATASVLVNVGGEFEEF